MARNTTCSGSFRPDLLGLGLGCFSGFGNPLEPWAGKQAIIFPVGRDVARFIKPALDSRTGQVEVKANFST